MLWSKLSYNVYTSVSLISCLSISMLVSLNKKKSLHEVLGPVAVFFELKEVLLEIAEDALEDGQLVEA